MDSVTHHQELVIATVLSLDWLVNCTVVLLLVLVMEVVITRVEFAHVTMGTLFLEIVQCQVINVIHATTGIVIKAQEIVFVITVTSLSQLQRIVQSNNV